jgi:hypothetical protein
MNGTAARMASDRLLQARDTVESTHYYYDTVPDSGYDSAV